MEKYAPRKSARDEGPEVPALIASMPATAAHRRAAFGIIAVLSVVFAVIAPFASTQEARLHVFIPVVQSIICFADLITAVFLFAQYSIQAQRALLVLAGGYIFSGLFAFLQTLDFPGAYSASGLLGGRPSGAAWLFSFWHITFPLTVIGYVLLKDKDETAGRFVKREPGRFIGFTLACVLIVTAALTWLGTAGEGYLPALFVDGTRQTRFVQNLSGAMWLLNATALVLLLVRMRTILDVWLVVTVFVSLPDLSLSFFYEVVRYSIGWYTARSYALVASCTVLFALLVETTMLYTRLASAMILQRREGANRIMSVDAATAAVAHEIKQPLASISLFAEAALKRLESEPPDLDEVRACLNDTISESARASDIVTSIRALFKPIARQKTLIEVNDLVRQVLRMTENDLHVQRVTVSTDLQADLPQIVADPTQLQQVILNLVKNGIESLSTGPAAVKVIRLVTTQAENAVSLSVSDCGSGINPKNVAQIFDPFFTTKPAGMGLGLSICRRIVEDHGGDLRLTRNGPDGCTFEVTFRAPGRAAGRG